MSFPLPFDILFELCKYIDIKTYFNLARTEKELFHHMKSGKYFKIKIPLDIIYLLCKYMDIKTYIKLARTEKKLYYYMKINKSLRATVPFE